MSSACSLLNGDLISWNWSVTCLWAAISRTEQAGAVIAVLYFRAGLQPSSQLRPKPFSPAACRRTCGEGQMNEGWGLMDYYRGIINWEKGNVQFYQKVLICAKARPKEGIFCLSSVPSAVRYNSCKLWAKSGPVWKTDWERRSGERVERYTVRKWNLTFAPRLTCVPSLLVLHLIFLVIAAFLGIWQKLVSLNLVTVS